MIAGHLMAMFMGYIILGIMAMVMGVRMAVGHIPVRMLMGMDHDISAAAAGMAVPGAHLSRALTFRTFLFLFRHLESTSSHKSQI